MGCNNSKTAKQVATRSKPRQDTVVASTKKKKVVYYTKESLDSMPASEKEKLKSRNTKTKPTPTTPETAVSVPDEISDAGTILRKFKQNTDVSFETQYLKGEHIGYGGFAEVFVGKHIASDSKFAVKKVDRSKMQWSGRETLQDEINCLRLVRKGPNIVQLYEVYEESKYCYLVMEYMQGGELLQRIIKKKSFNEKEARDVMQCIFEGLKYMHSRRVAHRDIKPDNLLLKDYSSDTHVVIADFTFAKRLTTHKELKTLCGTPGYLAPELLERWPAYDTKCDLWSAGVILFLLLGGYLPFDGEDEDEVFDQTRDGGYSFHPKYFKTVSSSAKNLVTTLLTLNPAKRSSARAALQHEWMCQEEAELEDKRLNVRRLRTSVLRDQAKQNATGADTASAADRVERLKRLYESYITKRSDSMTVFSNTTPPIASHPLPIMEDSTSGKSFRHFYDMGSVLGEGGFAIVKRARHKQSGHVVAVKDVDHSKLLGSDKNYLVDEIAALKLLRGHPHIVRLLDVFEEKTHTYIIMEHMKGGDVLERIAEKEVYTEREARELCESLFSAVDYMHKKNIAHRDLKPDNLLLMDKNDDTTVKIADLGFAKKVLQPFGLKTLCGTASYVAPEVLDVNQRGYDTKADMWSVGVIVYILLGGYAPFEGELTDVARLIIRGEYEFHDEYWSHVSMSAKKLIKSLLQVDPEERFTAEGALISEWMVTEAESLISRSLTRAQSQISKARPGIENPGPVKAMIHLETPDDLQLPELKSLARPSRSSTRTFMELYEPELKIEEGAFYSILEAKDKRSGVQYTIKCIDRRKLYPGDAVSLQDEIDALRTVADCPHIVRLHDVYDEVDSTYLVLDNVRGGNLIDRIILRQSYTEYDARQVCEALLRGVDFAHMRRVANRNLKPENILLRSPEDETDVMISDFSYAKKALYPNSLRTKCGTEGYTAPEILRHRPAYDVSCDMWSVGVTLYILLGGYRPFRGSSKEIMRKIQYGKFEFDDVYWSHISMDAKHLIRRMLTVNPNDRITAREALTSAWILADDDTLSHFDLSSNQDNLRGYGYI